MKTTGIRRELFTVSLAVLASLAALLPAVPVYAGTVTLSSTSGPPGTVLDISGAGFTAGATYTVTFGTTVVATGTVAAGGTVSQAFSVPVLPRNTYEVKVTTSNASDNTSPIPTFMITPLISVSTFSGTVGSQVSVTGVGFAASSLITVYYDSVSQVTASSNANGQFTTTFTVPQSVAGAHTITAGDFSGLSLPTSFTALPKVTLSTTTLRVGSTLSVTGAGFAGSSVISFLLDDVSFGGTVVSAANGSFTMSTLAIPEMAGGSHSLKAQDGSGNSAIATIVVTSTVTISPDNGTARTEVTVTGNGFFASTPISITWGGQAVNTSPASVVSDTRGSFTANFRALPGASAAYSVVMSDGTNTGSVTFTIKPTASISPTSGAVGSAVTVSGSGFRASVAATINYDNFLAASVSTDSSGNLSATFQVLPSPTGEHRITVTDQTNTLTFSFRVLLAAKLSPESGFVGSDVTVSGTGFASSRPVTVRYGDTPIVQSITDASGTIVVVFKAPVSRGGSHLVTITDGVNTETLTFAMDSTAPSAPLLLQPLTDTKADRMPTLDWSDVTDPSGLSYTLELATDGGFANVILRKQGLTNSAYTLTEAEKLKSVSRKTPYYWRVRAIDGAFNESPWATSSTFFVGITLESWAWAIIIIVSAVILGAAGYVIGLMLVRRRLH
ncbi:MAG: hypothetical protein HYX84_09065 [Chloroflexi bacterium]|nr:hypothetical protein [Chloroflexota bacterium]